MKKKCKVCGKSFEASRFNNTICSPECKQRKINENQRVYYARHKYELKEKYRKNNHKIVGFPCKFCGKEVKPVFTPRMHRYHFHEECMIDRAVEAVIRGETANTGILKFASNKGLNKSEIIEIAKERGKML